MENKKKSYYNNIYNKGDFVKELKYKDFNIKKNNVFVKDKKFIDNKSLIIFYAPWCFHCNKIYDDVRELSISNLNKFKIAAVNINDNKNKNYLLSEILNIKTIPTAYIIKNKKLIKFNNDVNFENLFFYINMNI